MPDIVENPENYFFDRATSDVKSDGERMKHGGSLFYPQTTIKGPKEF